MALFKNEIITSNVIPSIYIGKDCTSYKWFTETPKYSTFRINTLQTTSSEAIEILKHQLLDWEKKTGVKAPNVYSHKTMKDCVVVGRFSGAPEEEGEGNSEVMVDLLCATAVLRGSHIYAPGVLSMAPYVKEGDKVNIFADLQRKCKRGSDKRFGGSKMYIGWGIVRMERSRLFHHQIKELSGIAVELVEPISCVAPLLLEPHLGLLQNLPSIACCYALDPSQDDLVLDMCAAPGNKTTHLATLMNNKGRVIALDKTENKVLSIKKKCEVMGVENVECFCCDARLGGDGHGIGRPPFANETFDRVLLDSPCSALGQRPQLSNNISLSELTSFPHLQKQLFSTGYKLLKRGGVFVYSTCTITVEENEAVVAWALTQFPELRLVRPHHYFGQPPLSQGTNLTDDQKNCLQRFGGASYDSPEEDTIGFFIAKFVKVSSDNNLVN